MQRKVLKVLIHIVTSSRENIRVSESYNEIQRIDAFSVAYLDKDPQWNKDELSVLLERGTVGPS